MEPVTENVSVSKIKEGCSCDVPQHIFCPVPDANVRECNTLTVEQQKGLEDLLMKTRRENEHYLNEHPEIFGLIEMFVDKLLKEKPRHGFMDKALDFFTRPLGDLRVDVDNYLAAKNSNNNNTFVNQGSEFNAMAEQTFSEIFKDLQKL